MRTAEPISARQRGALKPKPLSKNAGTGQIHKRIPAFAGITPYLKKRRQIHKRIPAFASTARETQGRTGGGGGMYLRGNAYTQRKGEGRHWLGLAADTKLEQIFCSG